MFDVLSLLPGKKKVTGGGWHSFNAVCCGHRGHRADTRMRGGIKFEGQHNWVMNCFNCRFSCSFTLGRTINDKTRQFLIWCGVDIEQVQAWSLESLKYKDLIDFTVPKKVRETIKFKSKELPEGELLDPANIKHQVYVDYLTNRKIPLDLLSFVVTPNDEGRNANRIVIPYTYKNNIVGHTSRYLDNRIPKYINDQEAGYVFGYDFQKPDWQVCILTEGIFDAMSINACALTRNTINDDQARLLAQLNRKIIVVPDRDKAGLDLCDRALELGYSVSIPDWDTTVKDVNDAVVKYGRLATILSILQSATMSKIKIELRKRQIVKGI